MKSWVLSFLASLDACLSTFNWRFRSSTRKFVTLCSTPAVDGDPIPCIRSLSLSSASQATIRSLRANSVSSSFAAVALSSSWRLALHSRVRASSNSTVRRRCSSFCTVGVNVTSAVGTSGDVEGANTVAPPLSDVMPRFSTVVTLLRLCERTP